MGAIRPDGCTDEKEAWTQVTGSLNISEPPKQDVFMVFTFFPLLGLQSRVRPLLAR